tara:strand:+ start:233 stop:604 length:372 start_codon:yes stop_codon:yes gene_type:complete
LKAAANYSDRGYEIFLPMGNSRCDFIAMKDNNVIKVQCKTAATRYYKAKDTKYTLAVLTTSRNGKSKPYSPEEVDEFFVIGDTMAWAIPNDYVYPRKTIMLESTVDDYIPRHGLDPKDWRISL